MKQIPTLTWQQLVPQHSFNEVDNQETNGFLKLQPRLRQALLALLNAESTPLLLVKSHEKFEHAQQLERLLLQQQLVQTESQHTEQLRLFLSQNSLFQTGFNQTLRGVHYVFELGNVKVLPAQHAQDNFVATSQVMMATQFNENTLFGSLHYNDFHQQLNLLPGLVHKANGGILILSIEPLLAYPHLWQRLKTLLQTQYFSWCPHQNLPFEVPGYPLKLKVILLADREELAHLQEYDPEIYNVADYVEITDHLVVRQEEDWQSWASYLQQLAKQWQLPPLTPNALNRLYQLSVRDTEDRFLLPLSISLFKNELQGVVALHRTVQTSPLLKIDAQAISRYWQQKQQQYDVLACYAYRDILLEQVHIATSGQCVGQINGLSVVEYAGTPLIFGEPSRISCIVQFGEGEVIDVDRKNELAGNIHSKGMMIAQACMANLFRFQSQLPFSASLVFEQSYGEIDGDSASLAGFCVLASALAELALPQNIALTGAMDQFGNVRAVGGVNHKIEGFFELCQHRGLTGDQGVIIPQACLLGLSLSESVQQAVKEGTFYIWAVDNVAQAIQILLNRDLLADLEKEYEEDTLPLSVLITHRLEHHGSLPYLKENKVIQYLKQLIKH